MRYLEKVERRPDRIPDVRHPERVERRPDRIWDVRHPEKVGRRPDRIPDVGHPERGNVGGQNSGCETSGEGGTSAGQESFPGGMSYVARRRGDRLRVHGRESHVRFFREDPTSR